MTDIARIKEFESVFEEPKNRGGRPRKFYQDGPVSRRNISLAEAHMDIARAIGGGNASEGIRRALEIVIQMKDYELERF